MNQMVFGGAICSKSNLCRESWPLNNEKLSVHVLSSFEFKAWRNNCITKNSIGCNYSSMPNFKDCLAKLPLKLGHEWVITSYKNIFDYLFMPGSQINDENYASKRDPTDLTHSKHYDDVIMTTTASQITSLTVVYSTVYSDADQRKHQSSASLAFVWGIHRDWWIPRTKGQLRGKCFHLMTSSWTKME